MYLFNSYLNLQTNKVEIFKLTERFIDDVALQAGKVTIPDSVINLLLELRNSKVLSINEKPKISDR